MKQALISENKKRNENIMRIYWSNLSIKGYSDAVSVKDTRIRFSNGYIFKKKPSKLTR